MFTFGRLGLGLVSLLLGLTAAAGNFISILHSFRGTPFSHEQGGSKRRPIRGMNLGT